MLEQFTDAQDKSLQEAVGHVQAGNEEAVEGMERFAGSSEGVWAESSKRTGDFQDELGMGSETAGKQREAGQSVSVWLWRG
jgi:hypothetical protein